MGAAYPCVLVEWLDGVPKDDGVGDPGTRKTIARRFLFAMGDLHDQGGFRATADGPRLYPLLAFSTGFLNTDTAPDQIGDVDVPSEAFSFHEYAFGCADASFIGRDRRPDRDRRVRDGGRRR